MAPFFLDVITAVVLCSVLFVYGGWASLAINETAKKLSSLIHRYRVKVEKVDSPVSVHVLYMDYGNVRESVVFADFIEIKVKICLFYIFCIYFYIFICDLLI